MRGCLAALVALVLGLPFSVAAQEVPEDTERDLWCGLAFEIIAEQAPGDSTPEQKALAASYAEGGAMLTERARGVYLENGTTEERLEELIARLRTEIDRQVNATSAEPAHSYEECRVLLPF